METKVETINQKFGSIFKMILNGAETYLEIGENANEDDDNDGDDDNDDEDDDDDTMDGDGCCGRVAVAA